jgi:hypothetical protein
MKFHIYLIPWIALAFLALFTNNLIHNSSNPYSYVGRSVSRCPVVEFFNLNYTCKQLVVQEVFAFELDNNLAKKQVYLLVEPIFDIYVARDFAIDKSNKLNVTINLEVTKLIIPSQTQTQTLTEKEPLNFTFSCQYINNQVQCPYRMLIVDGNLFLPTTYIFIFRIINHQELTFKGLDSLNIGLVAPEPTFEYQISNCHWILFSLSIASIVIHICFGDYYISGSDSILAMAMSLGLVIFNIPYLNLWSVPCRTIDLRIIKPAVYSIEISLLIAYWMVLLNRLADYNGLFKRWYLVLLLTLAHLVTLYNTVSQALDNFEEQSLINFGSNYIHFNNWRISWISILILLCVLSLFQFNIIYRKRGGNLYNLSWNDKFSFAFGLCFTMCYFLISVKTAFYPMAKELVYVIVTFCVMVLRLLHSRKSLNVNHMPLPTNPEISSA